MSRKIFQKILAYLARKIIKKYKPFVIGVTGSVGKSSTKEAIYQVLKSDFDVRRNLKNYNNEIGLPLTILGKLSPGKNISAWLRIFWSTIGTILFHKFSYPKVLILEMAADHPGDIGYLKKIVLPNIAIVTSIAPVHLEFFKDIENIIKEKRKIIEDISPQGWVILNEDDELVSSMKKYTRAKVLTYGMSKEADVRAIEIEIDYTLNKSILHLNGLRFKVVYKGSIVPIFLPNIVSHSQVYAVLAAIACGVLMNLNIIEIANFLKSYQPLPGRMRPIRGIKNSLIIDDTYNSSPRAVEAALRTMDQINIFSQAKKWVILGDMKELGEEAERLHENVGAKVAKATVDYLVCYGELANDIAKGAIGAGMKRNNVFKFDNIEKIVNFLKNKIGQGDLILIKGSQAMHMEKIVSQIMLRPKTASKLLVRQGDLWA